MSCIITVIFSWIIKKMLSPGYIVFGIITSLTAAKEVYDSGLETQGVTQLQSAARNGKVDEVHSTLMAYSFTIYMPNATRQGIQELKSNIGDGQIHWRENKKVTVKSDWSAPIATGHP